MYITRDYMKVGSWQAIIDMINDKYNFQLYPGVVKLKSMVALGPRRTQIEIIPNRSTSDINLLPKITETVFTYDRLDCTDFFRNTIPVDITGLALPITTFDILKRIGDMNEIVFETDDFIHQTFDDYSVVGNSYVMVADSRSLRFVGQLKVRLIAPAKINLATFNTKVNEFPEVTTKPDLVKMRGDYLLSRYDFTKYRDALKDVRPGPYNNPEQFLGPISGISGLFFVSTNTPNAKNLTFDIDTGERRCKVLYNGAPIPQWSNRDDCERVLVLELSDTLCTDITGFLRLHYNWGSYVHLRYQETHTVVIQ